MRLTSILCIALVACLALPATSVKAIDWIGGGGDDLWSNPLNWSGGVVPAAADFARFPTDNTTVLIDNTVNAVANAFELGHPGPSDPFDNSGTPSVINMTGGTFDALTSLSNIGRGVTTNPNHLNQVNMSGGVMNLKGVSIPEAFNPAGQPGGCALCLPMNTEFNVSGNSVVNTGFIRLGGGPSISTMVIEDNAQVNVVARGDLGFTNGSMWLDTGFTGPVGNDGPINSILDIRDNAVLTVHGIHFIGRDATTNAAVGSIATQEEFDYYVEQYITNNDIILANGGANLVDASFANGVMTFRVGALVPEPTTLGLGLLALGCPLLMRRRG